MSMLLRGQMPEICEENILPDDQLRCRSGAASACRMKPRSKKLIEVLSTPEEKVDRSEAYLDARSLCRPTVVERLVAELSAAVKPAGVE